ncbi:expressed unknown protein [Seminavis robusta]|uniref:Uncharacterized protein n=1 Tax=Seminavis robusta TaxID=568900 RepID=A0A9N8F1U8_9STRA|nr:expressed unknown protein [Seminavis robusta]|eukprot:Sro3261_g345950.1 n/a (327) ;mRNA; r:100-1080
MSAEDTQATTGMHKDTMTMEMLDQLLATLLLAVIGKIHQELHEERQRLRQPEPESYLSNQYLTILFSNALGQVALDYPALAFPLVFFMKKQARAADRDRQRQASASQGKTVLLQQEQAEQPRYQSPLTQEQTQEQLMQQLEQLLPDIARRIQAASSLVPVPVPVVNPAPSNGNTDGAGLHINHHSNTAGFDAAATQGSNCHYAALPSNQKASHVSLGAQNDKAASRPVSEPAPQAKQPAVPIQQVQQMLRLLQQLPPSQHQSLLQSTHGGTGTGTDTVGAQQRSHNDGTESHPTSITGPPPSQQQQQQQITPSDLQSLLQASQKGG